MLRIFLLDETIMKINMNMRFTIFQLKTKIERQLALNGHEMIEAQNQRLIYRGQVLNENDREIRTIAQIRSGQIVHLVGRVSSVSDSQSVNFNLKKKFFF